jgi:manganese-dependent inorganic pyrophosphatase
MGSPIFVVGHVNPDTDSIASAIGYAWLLREKDGIDVLAARAGAINQQTSWVLKYIGIEPPLLITDASPRFESVMRRLDTTNPDMPLREAWSIASRTGGIAPVLDDDGKPYGLITGRSLFNFLGKVVNLNPKNEELSIQKLLDSPCKDAANTEVPKFVINTKIRDVINRILREEGDEFWVIDERGSYVGIVRQRDLLNPPRLRVVLVDHNEPQQSIASLEEAELIEILDHHRLGNPSTHLPIRMSVDIVGSTSTLVTERMEENGFSAPPSIAGVLLAGILSDTLKLTSPTTTDRDKKAAEKLTRWAFKKGTSFEHETLSSFGDKVLSASAGLSNRTPKDVVTSDLKLYNTNSYSFAIAQAEVTDLNEVSDHVDALQIALDALRTNKKVDFAMLMVTDIVRGSSRIILSNPPPILDELPYPNLSDRSKLAEGIVSRKKQLLPVVLGLLEN